MAIFLSYSRSDEHVIKQLVRGLQVLDTPVWSDLELAGGEVWWDKILEKIRTCDVFVFGLSNESLRSKACMAEINYAVALGKPIVPVRVGTVEMDLANPVGRLQVVAYRHDDAVAGFEMVAAVHAAEQRTRPLPDPLPPEPPIPYAYLRALASQIDTDELGQSTQIVVLEQLRRAIRHEDSEKIRRQVFDMLRNLLKKPCITRLTDREIRKVLQVEDPRSQRQNVASQEGKDKRRGSLQASQASVTEAPNEGARRRRATAAVFALITAFSLTIAAAIGVAALFHPTTTLAPTPLALSIKPLPATTMPGLLAAVRADPAAAGTDGPLLGDHLAAVAASTGERRRQAARRVLTLVAKGHLTPDYAHAATAAITPYTVLNAPVDLIADLSPDPAAGGPHAHFLLNCMQELQGKSPASQRAEANVILTRIPDWARNGGVQPDLVAAAIRIVTPVANGATTVSDAQTGSNPARSRPTDDDADQT
jgi:TIR domain